MLNKNNIWEEEKVQRLVEAFYKLETRREIISFMADILTVKELKEISKRLEIATKLEEGLPYTKIAEITGNSSTTIARVAKFLNGENGGYKFVINLLRKSDQPESKKADQDSAN